MNQKRVLPRVLPHKKNKQQNELALLTDVLPLALSPLLPTMFLLGSNHSEIVEWLPIEIVEGLSLPFSSHHFQGQ